MSKFIGVAHDEAIKGVARHFRQHILVLGVLGAIVVDLIPGQNANFKGGGKRSDRVPLRVSPKRLTIMSRLKVDGVWMTSVESSISTGSQSENQVLMAVGVSFCERMSTTCVQISLSEFIGVALSIGVK